jgi:hypothetical protein
LRATQRKRQASGRKQFFFEKKNQKTFAYQRQHLICPFEPAAWRKEQEFFVSFFQKRNTSFFCWFVSLYAGWYKTAIPSATA